MAGAGLWLVSPKSAEQTLLAENILRTLQDRGLRVQILSQATLAGILTQAPAGESDSPDEFPRQVARLAKLLMNHEMIVIVAIGVIKNEVFEEINGITDRFLVVYTGNPDGTPRSCPEEFSISPEASDSQTISRPGLDVLTIDSQTDSQESAVNVLGALEVLGLIPVGPGDGYTPEEVARVESRLKDLGYI